MAAVESPLESSAFCEQEFAWRRQDQTTAFNDGAHDWLSRAAPVTPTSAPDIEALRKLMPLRDPAKIMAFLRRHPELVPLLKDASLAVRRYWGVDVHHELELIEDPEDTGDDADSLAVCIYTAAPDAFAALDRFDEEWWLERLPRTQGNLNFLVCPQ